MRAKFAIQLTLGIISLLPLLFVVAGVGNELKLRTIRTDGIVVEGHVLGGGELTPPRGIKTHYLRVEFDKQSGESEVKTFPVDQDDYYYANQAGKLPITYVPGNPGFSRVGRRYGYDRTPLILAIMAFILFVAIIVVIHFLPIETHNQRLNSDGLAPAD